MSVTQILERQAAAGMTPPQAAEFIKSCDQFRTFREKVERYAGEGDLRGRLMAGLSVCHPEMKQDSLERKVRMWLNSKTDIALDRKTVIELAFILGLTTEQADAFLALMTDEGFRWRDPEEIVYIFALNQGMDFPSAEQLKAEIGAVDMRADRLPPQGANLTDIVRDEVAQLSEREELKAYLASNGEKFGKCRHRAWQLFMEYMERLRTPELDAGVQSLIAHDRLEAEKSMSTFAVLRNYLHRELIPQGSERSSALGDKRLDKVQKAVLSDILSAWPDENILKKIEKRSVPVSRKALILLFVALDEDPYEEDDDMFDLDEELIARERFESRCNRMNLMLTGCGFRQLDPRNPFDWMILYSIGVEDMFDSDSALDALLAEVFPGIEK